MVTTVTHTRTLSKSDFKHAASCEMKLYYRENHWPDASGYSPYLRLLAEGGFMVEALACALHPGGELIDSGSAERDVERSRELLRAENVTLYQAAFLVGRRFVKCDIVEKRGNVVRLIEVKAKQFDGVKHADSIASGGSGEFRTQKQDIPSKWIEKFEDLTYQVLVVEQALPGVVVEPVLLLVDKSKRSLIDDVPSLFRLTREDADAHVGRSQYEFLGTPDDLAKLDILTEVNADREVALLRARVDAAATHFESLLDAPRESFSAPLESACRACEFRTEPLADSGFGRCWGPMTAVTPHMLSLFSIGTVKESNGEPTVTALARRGKASLFDIPEDRLVTKQGVIGANAKRQLRQIHYTRSNTPWIGPALGDKLAALTYPMHFIDFEVSRLALPYHANMRPYGQVVFQWSCHTVDAPGATPRHREWLNDAHAWPNYTFVQTLREVVGDTEQLLTWSGFEEGRLKEFAQEHANFIAYDADLVAWVERFKSRSFDLHTCAVNDVYHPGMGGSTSIKVVLDALWKSDAALRDQYAVWSGRVVPATQDPYHALPSLVIAGVTQEVHEGTNAMRAYEAMMYGAERSDADAIASWRQLLLQYCELDTLSMVLVFEHWRRLTGLA